MIDVFTICTECEERCVINTKDPSCSKYKDRLWINRREILCRFCKDVATNCPQCAADKCRTGYGMQRDSDISEKLYLEFIARKGERI